MNAAASAVLAMSAEPADEESLTAWLQGSDALEFLQWNAREDDFVVYASAGGTFMNGVLVPTANVEPLDVDDLLSWNFNAYSSWGVDFTVSDTPTFRLAAPLDESGTKTFRGGSQLVFPRSFEGRLGEDKGYWEALQPFAQVFGLHFLAERNAYCWLDERGDIEDIICIDHGPVAGHRFPGTVITFKKTLLDEWMLLTDSVLVRTFDIDRRRKEDLLQGTDPRADPKRQSDGELFYVTTIEAGRGGCIRGCQLVRSQATLADLNERFGWRKNEDKEYASFIAHDWKHDVITEIWCAPGATANYFTHSDLPYETSPAFFNPEVLTKYKADSEKYRLADRSIHCRGTWSLKTYDINEAGQVHTYIVYLRDLPYEEQLHWKAHNARPKAPISKRAITTDFEGRFDPEYDPLRSLKSIVRELDEAQPPWWTLRSEKLLDTVNYPVTPSADEWAAEIRRLDQLLVEGFEEGWLRERAQLLDRTSEVKFRSLKLIEECLVGLGFDEYHAQQVTAPLRTLHHHRSKLDAHAPGTEGEKLKRQALTACRTYREHFRQLCAQCDEAIRTVREAFGAFA